MFIDNKYCRIYFSIINSARMRNHIKVTHDSYQRHHIIPRCMSGDDTDENLVYLTYKEHRVCHRLLIGMTEGEIQYKMKYAYKLFNGRYDAPLPHRYCTEESYRKMAETRKREGSYKKGKENVFARPDLVESVRSRMKEKNPMKDPKQRERMTQQNHRNKAVMTPAGRFISRAAALRHHGFKHWKILYDLMEKYPDQYYWA
jgi:hypothetical protein